VRDKVFSPFAASIFVGTRTVFQKVAPPATELRRGWPDDRRRGFKDCRNREDGEHDSDRLFERVLGAAGVSRHEPAGTGRPADGDLRVTPLRRDPGTGRRRGRCRLYANAPRSASAGGKNCCRSAAVDDQAIPEATAARQAKFKAKKKANAAEPPTSEAVTKAPLTASKAGEPTLDPRAWSISTPQEREAFVKAAGRSEIEATRSSRVAH
jgi:hypothetical protein